MWFTNHEEHCDHHLAIAERLLTDGDAIAGMEELAQAVLAKPSPEFVANQLPESSLEIMKWPLRIRYARALASAAAQFGHHRKSLIPLAQLLDIPATHRPDSWATVLREMEDADKPLELALLVSRALPEPSGRELLHLFPGVSALDRWRNYPVFEKHDDVRLDLLATYLELSHTADFMPETDELRHWLIQCSQINCRSALQLACAVARLEAARNRPKVVCDFVAAMSGVGIGQSPVFECPRFTGTSAAPELVAELFTYWLESNSPPVDAHVALHARIVTELREHLKQRLSVGGPNALVLEDLHLEPLWERLAALLYTWMRVFADQKNNQQRTSCAQTLVFFLEDHHNRNLAWIGQLERFSPQSVGQTVQPHGPLAQSGEIVPRRGAPHTPSLWTAAGSPRMRRLMAVSAIEPRDQVGRQQIRLPPMPPSGSCPAWLTNPVNTKRLHDMLRTHRGSFDKPVVWIGLHSLRKDVAVYAIELKDSQLQFYWPSPIASFTVSFREIVRADYALRTGIDRAWDKYKSKHKSLAPFADDVAATFRRHLMWVDKWLQPRLSAIWRPEWDGANVLLSLSPAVQSVMPELATVTFGADEKPLFARTSNVLRVPGYYGQWRLQNSPPLQRDQTCDLIAGAYLPELVHDAVNGPDVQRDTDGNEIRSPVGDGARLLIKYVRTLRRHGSRTLWLPRKDMVANRVVRALQEGAARNVLFLVHGYPRSGGLVLFDRVLEGLRPSCPLEIDSLLLISCEMGRLLPGSSSVSTVSHGLLAHLLAQGSRIGNLLAFCLTVPDLPAVALALQMLDYSDGHVSVKGPNLANARHKLFSELFDGCHPARSQLLMQHVGHTDSIQTFLQFALAASVVFTGKTDAQENGDEC